jgi:hypothetical protein
MYMLNLAKYGLGYLLGDFALKTSGHPDCKPRHRIQVQHGWKRMTFVSSFPGGFTFYRIYVCSSCELNVRNDPFKMGEPVFLLIH